MVELPYAKLLLLMNLGCTFSVSCFEFYHHQSKNHHGHSCVKIDAMLEWSGCGIPNQQHKGNQNEKNANDKTQLI